jgi:hypothetical protein
MYIHKRWEQDEIEIDNSELEESSVDPVSPISKTNIADYKRKESEGNTEMDKKKSGEFAKALKQAQKNIQETFDPEKLNEIADEVLGMTEKILSEDILLDDMTSEERSALESYINHIGRGGLRWPGTTYAYDDAVRLTRSLKDKGYIENDSEGKLTKKGKAYFKKMDEIHKIGLDAYKQKYGINEKIMVTDFSQMVKKDIVNGTDIKDKAEEETCLSESDEKAEYEKSKNLKESITKDSFNKIIKDVANKMDIPDGGGDMEDYTKYCEDIWNDNLYDNGVVFKNLSDVEAKKFIIKQATEIAMEYQDSLKD